MVGTLKKERQVKETPERRQPRSRVLEDLAMKWVEDQPGRGAVCREASRCEKVSCIWGHGEDEVRLSKSL